MKTTIYFYADYEQLVSLSEDLYGNSIWMNRVKAKYQTPQVKDTKQTLKRDFHLQ